MDELNFAKANDIIMLTFHPHCSHKLQPICHGVFGPIKKDDNTFYDVCISNNPGKIMTIYDIPSVVAITHPLAFTPKISSQDFVCQYNRENVDDDEFLATSLTDRPYLGICNEKDRPKLSILIGEDAGPDPVNLNEEDAGQDPIILNEEETPSLTNNTQKINNTIQISNNEP